MPESTLSAEELARHTGPGLPVTPSMAALRAAAPFIRAAIVAGVVTALIMVGLPAVLAIAAASSL